MPADFMLDLIIFFCYYITFQYETCHFSLILEEDIMPRILSLSVPEKSHAACHLCLIDDDNGKYSTLARARARARVTVQQQQ